MSELLKALVAARKEINPAKKGKINPHFKSRYADLEAVDEAVKSALESHGLCYVQDIIVQDGVRCVVTVLIHESGEEKALAPFPIVPSRPSDPQAIASANTYARRQSLQTALGVPASDDDGNAASAPAELSAPSAGLLKKAQEAAKSGRSAFKEFWAGASESDRKNLASALPALKAAVEKADAANEEKAAA